MAVSPRSRPGKNTLSLEAIVSAALAVIDEVGFEAATIRRVARALDTGPASLYVYVADRNALMTLAYDRALADVVLPTEQDGDWRARVELLVERVIEALAAHDDLATVVLADPPTGPAALRVSEELLRLLRVGAIDDAEVVWADDLLGQYIVSSALERAAWRRTQAAGAPAADPGETGGVATPMGERLRARYAALDPERYPTLYELRERLVSGGSEARAAWKLDVILDGLRARS